MNLVIWLYKLFQYQATRSNYTRVHDGNSLIIWSSSQVKSFYIDRPVKPEQGVVFHKRNRNIIIEVREDEDIEVKENFI